MKKRADSPTLTAEEYEAQLAKLQQQNAELTAWLKWYEEQCLLAQQKRFGASSEKMHPDQLELPLFNKAEVLATSVSQEPYVETVTKAVRS